MLADTDAGSLLTAAQSGARFRYAMVLPELALVPVLIVVQEIVVRLGVLTGKGHGSLIREHLGAKWAVVSGTTLFASAVGALFTEFAGIAGVGEMFGVSRWVSVPVATTFLVALSLAGSYRRVERVGVALGLAELAFVPAMLLTHPHLPEMLKGTTSLPIGDGSFLFLLAANVGAVVMPWMIFYQQSAIVDKGLTAAALPAERRDTAVGAVITQAIMIVVIVAFAATAPRDDTHRGLGSVGELANALAPAIGASASKALVGAAMLGASLVAALVVSLAGSWGIAEVLGWCHSLNERAGRENYRFYLAYVAAYVIGAVVVLLSADLVGLVIDVEVMNALLLPLVLGLLLVLEARVLPHSKRMHGSWRALATALCLAVIVFGLYMIPRVLG